MVMSKKGSSRAGKVHRSAKVRDRALDLLAQEKAANRGVLPKGVYSRVGRELNIPHQTIWSWWNESAPKEEIRERSEAAARTHAEQKAHIQEKAAHIMDRILDCAASMVEAQANGEQRTIISKQGNAFDVDYLSPKELAEVGKLIRETTFAERDPLEAVRQIEIILPEGRVEPLPKDPPPPPSTGGS